MVQPLKRTVWWFLTKPNIFFSYKQSYSLVFTQRNENLGLHKTNTQMFIAALFIMPKVESNQDVLQ